MKKIKTVGIIGVGALGVLYADQFTRALGREQVLVLADATRAARYAEEGIFLNGVLCDFQYVDAAKVTNPVDLLLFSVKFGGLKDAVETCRHLVGPETIVLSVLNGIASEQVLGEAYGFDKVVWCVAQKMAALKEGNRAVCHQPGELAVGMPAGMDTGRLTALTAFWDDIHFPYSLPKDISVHMWSKLLCNTGCNQAAMVYECGYAGMQHAGEARDTMLAAMREVVAVADAEGVPLTEADVTEWTGIIDGFDPLGEPSMRQDGKAHRKSEVELFSGTILRLAEKHGISVPVNRRLYTQIQELEQAY